jgi:GntR family transcriptional regulator, transcriptional repressor for pyruvate dehydrogenase complex
MTLSIRPVTNDSFALAPVRRHNLADDLAQRIKEMIDAEGYASGERLPTIAAMAKRFGVGHPTLREALKKLETLGMVSVRHGSGVYIGSRTNPLFVSNPVLAGTLSKKTLLDLVEARIPIELATVALAARNADDEDFERMEDLLRRAEAHLANDAVLSTTNMAFHEAIAVASGNSVLHQLLHVLSDVFRDEQHAIIDIYGSRQRDHDEHCGILEALREGDEELAVFRMRAHLEGVREVLVRWNGTTPSITPAPQTTPLS